MAVDLVFRESPAPGSPVALVFNSSEAASTQISLSVVGALPSLRGRAEILANLARVRAVGTLPALRGSAAVRYQSSTQRPVIGGVVARFQHGLDARLVQRDRAQIARTERMPLEIRAEMALPIDAVAVVRWQQGATLRMRSSVRYQQALALRAAAGVRYQEALRQRVAVVDAFAEAIRTGTGFGTRYQDALRLRVQAVDRAVAAISAGIWVLAPAQGATPSSSHWRDRYQDAIQPPGGLWFRPPVVPGEPCYVPSTDLVFVAPWSASTELVFVCERHGAGPVDPTEPPASLVIVPILRKYLVLNTASLRRVADNADIPITGMTLSLDADSWTWGFSARVPGSALPLLEPDTAGALVEAEARINGVAFRVLIESLSRDRVFGRSDLTVNGRGKAALLDAPYVPTMTFGNPGGARTAQQLANEILTVNTVPMGWDIDAGWHPENWLVPAGVFAHQGTYISAINAIAGAVGAYVQPHRTAQALSVLMRYPVKPWEWSGVTPDYQLPADVVQRESIAWSDKPRYNRVFVRGAQAGVIGMATRTGTAGDLEAPMVTDPLITAAVAARQRAQAVLSDVGRQAAVTLRMPVLDQTGIILPGKFVRYVDGGTTRTGLVRSSSTSVERSDRKLAIWQTLGVETHVAA